MCSMKDSGVEWIGEIPENSIICRLKYLLTEEMMYGANESGRQSPKNAVRYIRITDITPDGLLRDKNRLYLDYEIAEKYMLSDKDILFARSGASVGKSFIYRSEYGDCAFAGYLIKAKCNPKILLPDFLFYYSQCGLYEIWKSMIFIQSTIQNISAEKYGNLPVVLPEVHEQSRIVFAIKDRVRNIDMLIRNNETQIERLKQYKQSLITETVTRGLDPDASMKDSGVEWIGQIPESWGMRRVRDIGWTQNGISKDGRFFGHGFPFVSYGDVYRNFAIPGEVSGRIDSTTEERENYSVQAGDVFFTRTSETIDEVGFSSVCQKTIPDAVFAGFLIHLRPYHAESIVLTDYAKYYFRGSHIRAYLTKEMNLVTRASMSQGLLKAMRVLVPPMDEQKAITQYLDTRVSQIDALVSLKQRKIEKLKQYRQSLIYECVTGKLDLR